MNKARCKTAKGKALLVSLAEEEGNMMNRKTSLQIVEALRSKGIHAEVCKRLRG